ncbi:MAG: CRTAC1 family protein [Acidobacteria bacterium]|nr:CRTAC1 family protein [Acidobacteriota bacterium]
MTRLLVAGSLLVAAPLGPTLEQSPIRFEEIAAAAGVRTTHQTRTFDGPYADTLRMFTTGGASAAVADFDNDGLDDLFVTSSERGSRNRLFHNDGGLKFTDVTDRAGVGGGNDAKSIVADALWFDYDNDGWCDLLVVRFGTPILYRNQGNGRFIDVSAASGLTTFANSIAAIALDYDNDGRLDLLLGHYFAPINLIDLPTTKVLPHDLDSASNGGGVALWRNAGGGRFVDVTRAAGLGEHTGWTLDVGHGDFNNDGLQDVYLANDYGTDRLFMNQGGGRFRDVTATAIGFDTKKGMNVEVADYDNDGWLDIYTTNIHDEYMKECAMLWHNNGDGTFTDLSRETGTCDTLWGWGAKFADFDNDGWLDLFVTNGLRSAGPDNYIPVLVKMITAPGVDFSDLRNWPAIGNMTWSGYQRKKLHRNLGDHTFREMAAEAGVDNDLDGRGVAIADFDNDGRLDLYQTSANQPALLYRGLAPRPGNWVQLALTGRSPRDAVGARVTLTAAGRTQIREVDGGNGYAGQSTERVHVGIGDATRVDSLTIRWPDGQVEQFDVQVNRLTRIRQGEAARAR